MVERQTLHLQYCGSTQPSTAGSAMSGHPRQVVVVLAGAVALLVKFSADNLPMTGFVSSMLPALSVAMSHYMHGAQAKTAESGSSLQ